MADGRGRDAAVVVVALVAAVGVLAVAAVGAAVWLMRDAPRSFDERELDPIIAGAEVVEAPHESCGQGRKPVGDCDAVAEVRSRHSGSVVPVIAANAERAGYVAVDPGTRLYRAEHDDRCLSVVGQGSDVVTVYLSWC